MFLRRAVPFLPFFALLAHFAFAGGPRWVAGTSYFDPIRAGQPITWANGRIAYYTDLGDLSATVTQTQANGMVADAAALWSNVPTAAVSIGHGGSLDEDVSGTNFFFGSGGLTMPADVARTATATPLGVIYDRDGSVIDALYGAGASDPDSCNTSGVMTIVDNFSPAAAIVHALILVNGRCATDPAHIALLQYLLLRGFGRVLGLDWSQANDQMFPNDLTSAGLQGWPLMHPVEKLCNSNGNPCMTGTIAPRFDDIAALNRLYPVTLMNAGNFSSKSVTGSATVAIRGTLQFRDGQGMQGVNVVARPLIPGTDEPDLRYPVSAVSGNLFRGDSANAITGILSSSGDALNQFGTTAVAFQGWYDLGGIPLPPGLSQADYQLTFEAINSLYTGSESVGPYSLGQVLPSGTMQQVILRGLTAGSTTVFDKTIAGSAADANSGGDGLEDAPAAVPANGEWLARLGTYGHESWLRWHIRGGRQLSVEAQSLNENGILTEQKARPLLGVWNADDPLGSPPEVLTQQPFNAVAEGLTTLSFQSGNDGDLRIAIADQRGDGRPDYLYRGRVLYADSVVPRRLRLGGGPIVIDGLGFHPGNVVTVGGVPAQITSVAPSEITAIAPPAQNGGDADVTVTDTTTGSWSTIEAGSSSSLGYEAGNGDTLRVVTAPGSPVSINVPHAFNVRALLSDGLTPASAISITFSTTQGSAKLGCEPVCTMITGQDGMASTAISALSTSPSTVSATLANGASVAATFAGSEPPAISALSPQLLLAEGAIFNWSPQTLVLVNDLPAAGLAVTWSADHTATITAGTTITNNSGVAWTEVTAGPLNSGQAGTIHACLAGAAMNTPGCAQMMATGVSPASFTLAAISGIDQLVASGDQVAPVTLRVVDPSGTPIAGAAVFFYENLRLWSSSCPQQGSCLNSPSLGTATVEVMSDATGLVTLHPLTDPNQPTHLDALAVSGSTATLPIRIDRQP